MGFVRSWLLPAAVLFVLAGVAAAQTANGTISGHVAATLGGAVPGVSVTATLPNLGSDSSLNVLVSPTIDYVRYSNVWDTDIRVARDFGAATIRGIFDVFNPLNADILEPYSQERTTFVALRDVCR